MPLSANSLNKARSYTFSRNPAPSTLLTSKHAPTTLRTRESISPVLRLSMMFIMARPLAFHAGEGDAFDEGALGEEEGDHQRQRNDRRGGHQQVPRAAV